MLSPFPLRPHQLCLVGLCLLLGCLPGAKTAPDVKAKRTTELGHEGGGTKKRLAPFAVVFAGPEGEARAESEVTVVWNRPVRSLEVAGAEPAPPVNLTTKTGTTPEGAFQWIGTSAVVFVPKTHLPMATEFELRVPAGMKALDGTALTKETRLAFQTARPGIVDVEPGDGNEHLSPNQSFVLRTNQPILPEELARRARFRVGDGSKVLSARASYKEKDNPKLLLVTAASPFPLSSKITLEVDKGLVGIEGPLPTLEPQNYSMATYGPLRVKELNCARRGPARDHPCSPRGSVGVTFTNRILGKGLKKILRVEPAVPIRIPSYIDDDTLVDDLEISLDTSARRSYRLVIAPGLVDEYGQTLREAVTYSFSTDDYPSEIGIGVRGTVLEAGASQGRKIPVASMNYPSYELHYGRLSEEDVVRMARDPSASVRLEFLRSHAGLRHDSVKVGGLVNQTSVREIPLAGVLGEGGRGVMAVGYSASSERGRREEAQAISVTDLAITGKLSRFGSFVSVTRLSDGKPVSGATVVVRNPDGREAFQATTDAQGFVTVPKDAWSPVDERGNFARGAILVARSANDWTYRPVDEIVRGDLYPNLGPLPWGQAMLFTERGVYRPGETMRVKGMVRRVIPRGTETPKGEKVTVTAHDEAGDAFFSEERVLDAFGAFSAEIAIPKTAHMGSGRVEVTRGKDETLHSAPYEIGAYKPSEFKVGVDAARDAYVRGDKAEITLHGEYLFGSPMNGQKASLTVSRTEAYFAIPGLSDFVTNDEVYFSDLDESASRRGRVENREGLLDGAGRRVENVALPLPGQRGPERLLLEADVEDISRQHVSARSSVLVHPGEFYIGLLPPSEYFQPKGKSLPASVMAIEPSGKRRAGVSLRVELLRRTWTTVVQTSGEDEGHYVSKAKDEHVAACSVTTRESAVSCPVTTGEPGYYVLRALGTDPRGNAVSSSVGFYVVGEGASSPWKMGDTRTLELVPDKSSYEVGETARILVKSPFPEAEALITVERDGVYRQERKALRGSAVTFSVPITEDFYPNAFVSVHLARGRTEPPKRKGVDLGAPQYRLGYAELAVQKDAKRLSVALLPKKKEARPGEEAEVSISVRDRRGTPVRSQVTFYAVDEGVLMLTGYRTPDPLSVFSAPRALRVYAVESRADLARIIPLHFGNVGLDKGDEGGGGGAELRSDFRVTAHFAPSVLTDSSGNATVRFALPHALTSYRLMAVAASETDQFGFGESSIVTKKPLMLRPTLPRFLRVGDEMRAGTIVQATGNASDEATITLSVDGLDLVGQASKSRKSVLRPGVPVELRWPLVAPNVRGAKIAFSARAGGERDAVEVTREVKALTALEAVAAYGETESLAAEQFGDLSSIRTDTGGLSVRLSSTALSGLSGGIEQLVEYPYGCTEQMTSRLLALVPLRGLAHDFGVPLPKDVDVKVDETLPKIVENQHSDGLFGYWKDSPRGDPWLTAYVLFALKLVENAGKPVPKEVFSSGIKGLRRSLAWRDGLLGLETKAVIADALAHLGAPDPGLCGNLFGERKKLAPFAKAHLLSAMTDLKMEEGAKTLLEELSAQVRLGPGTALLLSNASSDYAPLLDSDVRTTALYLRALTKRDPTHPLLPSLAKGILSLRRQGQFGSTQEAAWALVALSLYKGVAEKTTPSFDANLFVGDKFLGTTNFSGRSLEAKPLFVPAAELTTGSRGLAFQVEGSGKLFYEARLRYAPKVLPKTALDRGFSIHKWMRVVKPSELASPPNLPSGEGGLESKAGDLVLVDLVLVSPEVRHQVVLDDPLPAGLEAIDSRFVTSGSYASLSETSTEDDDDESRRATGRAFRGAPYHREVHDDRVLTFVEHMEPGMYHYRYLARATTAGTFSMPPTRAECMYEPEVFGRTAGKTFVVREP